MKSFKVNLLFLSLFMAALALGGCHSDKNDNSDDYAEWKDRNDLYVEQCSAMTGTDGNPIYTRVVPSWSPLSFYLRQWLSDRSATVNQLTPLDNSLVSVSYMLQNIDGTVIDATYWGKTNPDEGYITHPYENVIGFHHLLTTMRVGDEARIVVPYTGGYGNLSHGSVLPYSTLIFTVRLLAIRQYVTN